ncbi:MAG: hypothetical protein WCC64_16000 [Aliidongia sp.]
MTRLSILPIVLVGLALVGCTEAPTGHPVNPSDTTATGTLIPGVSPESPGVTVGRDQIDLTQQNTASDILQHTSAGPLLQIHH